MDLSIIVPFYNEKESLTELATKIHSVLEDLSFSYEICFVDD